MKNYNTHLLKAGLSKSESNLLKALESIMPKKSFGGDLLSMGASFIPGGQFLAPMIQMADAQFSKMNKPLSTAPAKLNSNPFGNILENGGIINDGFKQYNTGSHNSGMDLKVDKNGNASNQAVASVQGKENMFKVNGTPFVMSDVLVNPETGNTFNKDAAKLNKSLPNSSYNIEDKNSLKFGMERLSKLNDIMKGMKEQYQLKYGGKIKQYENGGPFDFVPRRVDINGREYNYITDAPQFDLPLIAPFDKLPQVDMFNNSKMSNFDTLPQADQYPEILSRTQPRQVDISSNNILSAGNEPNSDVNSFSGDTKDIVNNSLVSQREPFNGIAIGLKGLGLAKSIADSLEKPEVEQTILPDYTKSDRYMAEANIDYTQARQNAIGASNIARNVNRSGASNFAQFQNREMARTANLIDAVSNIDMQENNARSSLNVNRSQYEQSKAIDKSNREVQNRINNQMNKANADFADQKLFSEISQIGTEFNKYQNFKNQISNNKELQQYYINEALALINSQSANFKLDPEFVNKLKSGNYTADDVVKVVNMTGLKF